MKTFFMDKMRTICQKPIPSHFEFLNEILGQYFYDTKKHFDVKKIDFFKI